MSDIDHHVFAEISSNGTFVCCRRICGSQEIANACDGIVATESEGNDGSGLHELSNAREEWLVSQVRVMFGENFIAQFHHLGIANSESSIFKALDDFT